MVALRALRDLDNPVFVPHPQFFFSHAVLFGFLGLSVSLDWAFSYTVPSNGGTSFQPRPYSFLPAHPPSSTTKHPSSVHPFKEASGPLEAGLGVFSGVPSNQPFLHCLGRCSTPLLRLGESSIFLEHAGRCVPPWPPSCNAHHRHKEAAPPNVLLLAVSNFP